MILTAPLEQFSSRIASISDVISVSFAQSELVASLIEHLSEPGHSMEGGVLDLSRWNSAYHSSASIKQVLNEYVTVACYGAVEDLVLRSIEEWVGLLPGLYPTYSDLPERLRNRHWPDSITLLSLLNENRVQHIKTSATEVLASMISCLNNSPSFKMLGETFTINKGNMKVKRLLDLLSSIGIDNPIKRICASPKAWPLLDELRTDKGHGNDNDERCAELLKPWDNTVEDRNIISHGRQLDSLLSKDLLLERLRFAEMIGNSVIDVLRQEWFKSGALKTYGVELKKPSHTYQGGLIICVAVPEGVSIRSGQWLVGSVNSSLEPVRIAKILSMEMEGVSISEASSGMVVALRLDVKFTDNHYCYVLPHLNPALVTASLGTSSQSAGTSLPDA